MHGELEAWNKRSGELIQKSATICDTSDSASGEYNVGTHGKIVWRATRTYKAQVFYCWKVLPFPGIGTKLTRLRYYLEKFGFELNPKVLWDGIPFSFLVDQFFGVGAFLNSMRFDTLKIPLVLVDSFVQVKDVLEFSHYYQRNAGLYEGTVKSAELRYNEDLFTRRTFYVTSGFLTGTGFRLPPTGAAALDVSLATALILGRRAPKRPRRAQARPFLYFPSEANQRFPVT